MPAVILAGTIPTTREFSYADKIWPRIHFACLRQSSTNRNRIPADIAAVRGDDRNWQALSEATNVVCGRVIEGRELPGERYPFGWPNTKAM